MQQQQEQQAQQQQHQVIYMTMNVKLLTATALTGQP